LFRTAEALGLAGRACHLPFAAMVDAGLSISLNSKRAPAAHH